MKMKTIIKLLFVFSLPFIFCRCADDGIHYEREINVPEGIYLTGSASQFSVEAINGKMNVIKEGTLVALNTWLTSSGDFYISLVGPDGQPVYYGQGALLQNDNSEVSTYSLAPGTGGFRVMEDGLYQLIVNPLLKQVNIVPFNFRLTSKFELTEDGENELFLQKPSYDHINHVATWVSSGELEVILPAEFSFNYTDNTSFDVKETDTEKYTFSSMYTGTGGSIKMNVLTEEYAELTNQSQVQLNLKNKGEYKVTLQYEVLTGKFFAKMTGNEIIEPEPEGYPEKLYMIGDEFGNWNWNSTNVVEMAPVGQLGNGAFWTIKYFNAGQGIKWASEKSDAESFASLGTNVNYVVGSNGRATVETSGLYLVYVDMNRNLIAFEKPAVYGIGECFDGQEVSFDLSGQNFSAVTTTQGNLQMYATSDYNNRDWNTMEFNIYNGQIYYRGVGAALEPVPVASNIPIELDFSQDRGKIAVTFASPSDVPSTAKAIYMVGDEFGNMNWGSDGVISLDKVWNSADRWIHINYFNAGTKLRFSTSKIFGDGEFTGLSNNVGFEISDEGLVVIPQSGTYIIFVDLGSKTISIQKPVIYGYGTAAGGNNEKILPFTESSDGKTFSVTLPNGGRFRIHPYIPAFDNLNPSFGAWKREYAVNPETLEIYLRKEGMDEPNKDYVWAANTIITLDFRAAKGTIVVP